MKKLLAFVLLLVIGFNVQAQEIVKTYSATVANSASKTMYVKLASEKNMVLDSIAIQGIYTGEIDIDKMIVTKGVNDNGTFRAVATPDTTTLTVNNDSLVVTAGVYSPTSTGLNSLVGYDHIKIVFVAASTGNDATDPNSLQVKLLKYFSIK